MLWYATQSPPFRTETRVPLGPGVLIASGSPLRLALSEKELHSPRLCPSQEGAGTQWLADTGQNIQPPCLDLGHLSRNTPASDLSVASAELRLQRVTSISPSAQSSFLYPA